MQSQALIISLIWKEPNQLKNRNWVFCVLLAFISAISVALNGSCWSVWSNLISLAILSSLHFNPETSAIGGLIYAILSYSTSGLKAIECFLFSNKTEGSEEKNSAFTKFFIWGIPVLITVLFFCLYRSSNPLFDDLASKINFNFLSIGWCLFTLMGLWLLYGFFHPKQLTIWANWEKSAIGNVIQPSKELLLFGKKIPLKDEHSSGMLLLASLNALLIVVNLLDFNYFFISHQLPKYLSHSQFVHQGINTLILSILVAIVIILFLFRGKTENLKNTKGLKLLAYFWILQNIFMVVSTIFRNLLYAKSYDREYLLDLSESNLDILLNLGTDFQTEPSCKKKLELLQLKQKGQDWKATCLSDWMTLKNTAIKK